MWSSLRAGSPTPPLLLLLRSLPIGPRFWPLLGLGELPGSTEPSQRWWICGQTLEEGKALQPRPFPLEPRLVGADVAGAPKPDRIRLASETTGRAAGTPGQPRGGGAGTGRARL